MKKYTIKDIADLSGVSVATVSRVINNNGRFSEETRKKVEKVIKDTGYQTNYSAKSLRMNKSLSIGILVPDITNYFFADVVQKIETLLFSQGYSSIICNTNRDKLKEQAYLNILEGKGVDGIVVISGADKFDFNYFSDPQKPVPYVCINRDPENISDTVFITSDHYQGSYEATEELFRQGCKNPIIAMHNRQSSFGNMRFVGFKDSLEKHGITYSQNKNYFYVDRNSSSIEKDLKSFIDKHPKTDGIFAFTDKIAMELLLAIRKLNLKVPDDIKIIGFDDNPINKYLSPTLSSVKQDNEAIAKAAVEHLLNLIDYPSNTGKYIKVPVKLNLRESSQGMNQI